VDLAKARGCYAISNREKNDRACATGKNIGWQVRTFRFKKGSPTGDIRVNLPNKKRRTFNTVPRTLLKRTICARRERLGECANNRASLTQKADIEVLVLAMITSAFTRHSPVSNFCIIPRFCR